jgi:hypothetical protein
MWVTDPEKYDYWEKALQWESAFQMQYLHDFLAALEWWRLEPAPDLIRNQPDDVTRRMTLARSAAGDLAVAYLPDNDALEIDLSAFPSPLVARWFDPVRNRYTAVAGRLENQGVHRFAPPAKGDWVLLLQHRDRRTTGDLPGNQYLNETAGFRSLHPPDRRMAQCLVNVVHVNTGNPGPQRICPCPVTGKRQSKTSALP